MRKYLWHSSGTFFLACAMPSAANAQAPQAPELPAFQTLRWEEDYRFFAQPHQVIDSFEPVKYICWSDDPRSYLTLSGQFREQWLTFHAPSFGLKSAQNDDYRYQRVYIGADVHFNEQARAFIELADMQAFNKRLPLVPTDQDRADVQVAFVDYALPVGDAKLTARVGRQEIQFDETQRFLGVRDGPNVRLAFDAALAQWTQGSWEVTAFAGSPVKYVDDKAWDDHSDASEHFGGARITRRKFLQPDQQLDVYAYRLSGSFLRFGKGTAPGGKNTLGARLSGRSGSVDWDAEGASQTGDVASERVRAWAVSALAGYEFALPGRPRIGLQADMGSGDSAPSSGVYRTFDPLFPKGAYFNDAALTGFSNVENLAASIKVTPIEHLTVVLSDAEVRKHVLGDFAYQSTTPIAGSDTTTVRRVGRYVQGFMSYDIGRHVDLEFQVVRYQVSSAMRAIGARDTTYSKFTVDFRF